MMKKKLLPLFAAAALIISVSVSACSDKVVPSISPTSTASTPLPTGEISGVQTSKPTDKPVEPAATPAPAPTEKPLTQEEKSLLDLRSRAKDAGKPIAVAYAGYIMDGSYENGLFEEIKARKLLDEYSFISQIPKERFVETSGDELYCIVPTDENATVTVYQWLIEPVDDDVLQKKGEMLYKSEKGEPILIRGNISDILPNMQIVVTDQKSNEYEYIPYLSLESGLLGVNENDPVYDFSVYPEAVSY